MYFCAHDLFAKTQPAPELADIVNFGRSMLMLMRLSLRQHQQYAHACMFDVRV